MLAYVVVKCTVSNSANGRAFDGITHLNWKRAAYDEQSGGNDPTSAAWGEAWHSVVKIAGCRCGTCIACANNTAQR